jgi:DNA-binding response OmpR family regulator/predicted ATPase
MTGNKSRVLVVVREPVVCEALVKILVSAGYGVEVADAPRRARDVAAGGNVALAVLAPAGLGAAGFELARDLAGTTGGLIVVAEQRGDIERLASLDLGADAHICKPLARAEVLAQVRRVLERDVGHQSDHDAPLLTFDRFTLDAAGHSLVGGDGREVPLTRAEFALLVALARHPGRVMTREQLLGPITGHNSDAYDRSVDVMVWRLRRKIEPDPKQPKLIVTVPGVGYKLAAKVRPMQRAPETSPTDARRARASSVERRHVTVLSCELVGLAALSTQLDPEDIRTVISECRRVCADVVADFGTSVARSSGDGILYYFGYPEAHEDDAEQAVRAGLAIIDAVAVLAPGIAVDLHARIGIASGVVVAGDLAGGGADPEMVGVPPILAARLSLLAPPDAVLIAAPTHDLVGDLFRYAEVGPLTVPDVPQSTAAWHVIGEGSVESRFDALRKRRRYPMVGREEEMELLLRRWRQSSSGDGRVVLVSGEPGIGKSCLVKALSDRVEAESCTRLYFQCSPYHRDSALHPIVAHIERSARFQSADEPERRLEKLEDLIAITAPEFPSAAPLLAALLSVPTGSRYPQLGLTPVQQRRQTLALLLDMLAGLGRRRPVLLIFEDAHWADATSLEWLDLAIKLTRQIPIMVAATFRLEFKAPWSGLPNVTTLLLGRLEPHHVRAMITSLSGDCLMDAAIVDRIVDQSDGVPLYVEELTKSVLESALLPQGWSTDAGLPPLAIPLTLQDYLMARVDRLGSAREVVQLAATIGRDFSFTLLKELIGRDEVDLVRALEDLEQSELVYRRGSPPDATYGFTHSLVQEAIYETLLKSRRQALHARIAELLRDRLPMQAEAEPEVAAHHFTEAGWVEQAAEWWGKAGARALQQSAYVEAISHLRKALSLAERVPGSPRQRRLQLHLQIAYGQALISSRGHGQPETTAAFARARELADEIESPAERFSAYYGMWVGSFARAELGPLRELSERFLREVAASPDLPEAGVAHRLVGATLWFQGDFVNALPHLERAVAAHDVDRDRALASRFGQDVGVSAMLYLAIVLWLTGDTQRAHRLIEVARTQAQSSGHIPTMAYMYGHSRMFFLMCGDGRAALENAEAGLKLSREHRLPLWFASGTLCLGAARWQTGDRVDGLAKMREGMALWREQGAIYTPLFVFLLAEAEALSGQVETGISLVTEQLAEVERSGQRWLDAELHRRHAELLMWRSPVDMASAEAAFGRALGIARVQRAKVFELRAALGLAGLFRSQGDAAAALNLLAPIEAAWREGCQLPELEEARLILRSAAGS